MAPDVYYAHTRDGRPPAEWQRLKEHLRNVARMARAFAQEARPGDAAFAEAAYWAGMLHDLGKYTEEFQRRLWALGHGRTGAAPSASGPKSPAIATSGRPSHGQSLRIRLDNNG